MKTLKSLICAVGVFGVMGLLSGCTDWGEADYAAAGQVFADRQIVGTYPFQYADALVQFTDVDATNSLAEIVQDDDLGSDVLHLDSTGFVRIANPLNGVSLQDGAALTFWVKTSDENLDRALLSFGYDMDDEAYADSARFYFTRNAQLVYEKPGQLQSLNLDENNPASFLTGVMGVDTWHFIALQVSTTGYQLYVDGFKSVSSTVENPSSTSFHYQTLVNFLNSAPYIYIGKGSVDNPKEMWLDDLTVIRNHMIARDWARPNISGGGGGSGESTLPTPVYFNDFNSQAGVTVVGSGYFRTDESKWFGSVFQNVTSTAPRQNYLLLPEDVLSHSAESKQMTIGVWVNAANAGASSSYMWAPLFTAYAAKNAENTFPMFACQYRGVLQVNCAGWSDFTDAQNVAGVNTLYHDATDWLADKQWHYYTVVLDGENAKVYFDGVVVNEWNNDGINNTQGGLFSNGGDLKYICLGGNQAWNWGDNDPGFAFDDIAIYDVALSAAQIQQVMDRKYGKGVDVPASVYRATFDNTTGLSIVGGGKFYDKQDAHGMVFQNAPSTAPRQNYLLLPEDVLSHSADSKQMSISFWVNAEHAGASASYMWAPLFAAYGAKNDPNTWPMFICQVRGVLQVNCAGWSDFTDAQNVAGVNTLYHDATDWLADKQWHLYTVVLDGENAKVYFDGEVVNEWNNDGINNTQGGLFSNGGDLKYICLGGNQAWNWADNDAGFEFDDFQVFDIALTPAQIQALLGQY